ncbi:MAG: hypothetical protein ACI8TQ_002933 [Planctomycetota bacterium]|jgi:hypothetical protein
MNKCLRVIFAAALVAIAGCNTVEFYEKGAFQDPAMDLAGSGSEAHFHQKVFYSMEGSAGGIGSSAGGGCGCY